MEDFFSYKFIERHRRMSLRPSFMLNAIRRNSAQRSNEETAAASGGLPNGVIKTGGEASTTQSPSITTTAPIRRLTRFSTLLRASPDSDLGDGDSMANLTPAEINSVRHYPSDHRILLTEVLCCCCQCCRSRDSGYPDGRSADGGARRRGHRDGSGGASGNSERRGDYANLIENHRLARLVTLLAVLAILGLVLTYIIRSIIEQKQQQQQQQQQSHTTPFPIGQNPQPS